MKYYPKMPRRRKNVGTGTLLLQKAHFLLEMQLECDSK